MKRTSVTLEHLHENRGLYIMTVFVRGYTGWFFKSKWSGLENYVSCNGESWFLMPDKVKPSKRINDLLRKEFQEYVSWELIEELHADS